MSDPLWLARARSFIGLRELPGKNTSTTIAGWLAKLKAPWKDDETPWCGTFVAAVLSDSGFKPVDGWAGARKWLNFGVKLPAPALGCIVVFWRGNPQGWSGHVGFVVGKDAKGNLMVLGGNQGDMVSIKPFSRDRTLGYRWPAGVPTPTMNALPLLTSDGKVSTDEA
jgi:uncharacterized protein (TIGR02594 family)